MLTSRDVHHVLAPAAAQEAARLAEYARRGKPQRRSRRLLALALALESLACAEGNPDALDTLLELTHQR